MSLTEVSDVFAGIHEDAINDLLRAVATDRPRLLAYGSPAFVPSTTANETRMDAIAFPGIAGGIDWRLRFDPPHVDLFDKDEPLPPELTLHPGSFSMRTSVELCVACRRIRLDPKPPRPREDPDQPDEPDDNRPPVREATCCRLDIVAVGSLQRVSTSLGEEAIAFDVHGLEIVDVAPNELESVLECVLFMILQAVLSTLRLPLRALRVGAFSLTVTAGPLIEDDQIKVRGDF